MFRLWAECPENCSVGWMPGFFYDVGCVPVNFLIKLNVWIFIMVAGSLDIYDGGWEPG